MQAFSGLSEVSAGAGFALGSVGWGAPLGFAVMGHGMDHFLTGMKTMITGSNAETATSQILQKTGFGGQTANLIDNSLSIAGMAKGAASTRLAQVSKVSKSLPPTVGGGVFRSPLLIQKIVVPDLNPRHLQKYWKAYF